MRTQYCRDHIDDAAENCNISSEVITEIKRATGFAYSHPLLDLCATTSILALMRIPDPEVKELTIAFVEKRLSEKTPTGGIKTRRVTEKQVRTIQERFELQKRSQKKAEAERRLNLAREIFDMIKDLADEEGKKK